MTSLGMRLDVSGLHEMDTLDGPAEVWGLPEAIVIDNGHEFAGRILGESTYWTGVKLRLIDLNKPMRNTYVVSVNRKFWDECMNILGLLGGSMSVS